MSRKIRLLKARDVLLTHWRKGTYSRHIIAPTINKLYQYIYVSDPQQAMSVLSGWGVNNGY